LGCAVPGLQARTCVGNSDLVGAYGWSASRTLFTPISATAPGTTGAFLPIAAVAPGSAGGFLPGSSTALGGFLSGAAGGSAFASVGKVLFDGAGNILASSAPTSAMNVRAGTYTVNTDCTVTMSLSDVFATSSTTTGTGTGGTGTGTGGTGTGTGTGGTGTGTGGTGTGTGGTGTGTGGTGTGTGGTGTGTGTTTGTGTAGAANGAAINLEGIIVDTGNEIDLIQTGTASGSIVTLKRTTTFNACTNASLNGMWGFVASGIQVQQTMTPAGVFPAITPFSTVGRFNSNGSGTLTSDTLAQTSTVKRLVTGTYTVNTDCTGTMKLTDVNNVSRTVNFVIANETAGTTNTGIGSTAGNPPQVIQLVFVDAGITGSGEARPQ